MTEDEERLQKDSNVLNVTVEKVIDKTVDSYSVTGDMHNKMSGIVAKKKEEDELMNTKKKWLEDKPKERKNKSYQPPSRDLHAKGEI